MANNKRKAAERGVTSHKCRRTLESPSSSIASSDTMYYDARSEYAVSSTSLASMIRGVSSGPPSVSESMVDFFVADMPAPPYKLSNSVYNPSPSPPPEHSRQPRSASTEDVNERLESESDEDDGSINSQHLSTDPGLRLDLADSDLSFWNIVSQPHSSSKLTECPKCSEFVLDPSLEYLEASPALLGDLSKSSSHEPLLNTGMLPGLEAASKLQALCFAACLYAGQQNYDLLAQSLQAADQTFAKMIREENNLILLSVLQVLNILHVHDRGTLTSSIMRSAHRVAISLLGEVSPIALTIEWMTAAGGSKLATSRIKISTLREMLTALQDDFGDHHYHSITVLYCLAFQLAYEHQSIEAETLFDRLVNISDEVLGPMHLVTVAALNGLGRAQTQQHNYGHAIETLKKSIQRHPLGANHPFRLESLRRLALLYTKVNRNDSAESIYWTVLKGRIKTLGKTHNETLKARAQLEKLLKVMGRWDPEGTTAQKVQALFEDEEGLFMIDPKRSAFSTPLLWAAENGDEELVKLLLEKSLELDPKDGDGQTRGGRRGSDISTAAEPVLYSHEGVDPPKREIGGTP